MRIPLAALFLAACTAAPDGTSARQVTVPWDEIHRVYVADSRQGVVRAFSTWDTPRAAAEGRAPGRRSVLDMKLDKAHGRLWVLGPDGLYLHDATSLVLLRRYPAQLLLLADSRLAMNTEGEVSIIAR